MIKDNIVLTENDILYICVSTKHNTINLYPIPEMELMLNAYPEGKIHSYIISSKKAINDKWTDRIEKLLPNPFVDEKDNSGNPPFTIEENKNVLENANLLWNDITKKYKLDETKIVINYGGGLKIFTVTLWLLKDMFQDQVVIMTYPEKFYEKLIWTEFLNGEIINDLQKNILIKNSSEDIIKLYTDNKKFPDTNYTFLNNAICSNNFTTEVLSLPNFYEDEGLKNFLFEVTSSIEKEELSVLNVGNFFEKLNSTKDEKVEQLIDNAKCKIKTIYNSNKNYPFKIVDELKLEIRNKSTALTSNDVKETINHLKNIFWSFGTYLPIERYVALLPLSLNKLESFGLNFPSIDVHNKVMHSDNIIKDLFSKNSLKINNHGNYFELLCLKIVTLWAVKNNCLIHEIAHSIKETDDITGKQIIEFDIMIYTKKGNIYFIECKTFDFKNKEFMAAYFKAKDLGGVFNKYIIVVPAAPSDSSPLKSSIEASYERLSHMSRTQGVLCCQLNPGNNLTKGFIDFEKHLQDIAKNESK